MSFKSKQDWSQVMDQLNAEGTPAQPTVQPTVQPERPQEESPQMESAAPQSGPLPHLAPSKTIAPQKSNKSSFLDRLASINLFGTASPEKADRSAAVPQLAPSFESRSLENIHSEPIEETPVEPEPQYEPQREPEQEKVYLADVADPWSRIARQVDTHAETIEETDLSEPVPAEIVAAEPQEQEPENNEYAIPDIEQLVSFRDLPPVKKKTPPKAPPAPAKPVVISTLPPKETTSQTPPAFGSRDKSKNGRRDFKDRDSQKERKSTFEKAPEKAERTRALKKRRPRSSDSFEKEQQLEMSSVYDEPMELEELDLVAPAHHESLPAFSLGQYEDEDDDEEITVLRSRKNRNRKPSPPKSRERIEEPEDDYDDDYSSTPQYAGNYFEEADDVDEIEDDYDDPVVSHMEREYGPPRDVFADLPDSLDDTIDSVLEDEEEIVFPTPSSKGRGSRIPDSKKTNPVVRPVVRQSFPGAGSVSERSQDQDAETPSKGRLTRGSKVRTTSVERPAPERANLDEEDDLFSGFSQKPKRGSAFDPASQRPERPTRALVEEDDAFEEEPFVPEKKKIRTRATARKPVEPDFRDERDEQEEEEMRRLHTAIPSWDDAILPVVESNIARRSQPRRNVRKR